MTAKHRPLPLLATSTAAALLVLAALGLAFVVELRDFAAAHDREDRSRQVLDLAEAVSQGWLDAESAVYYASSGSQASLAGFAEARARTADSLAKLQSAPLSSAGQQASAATLATLVNSRLAWLDGEVEARARRGAIPAPDPDPGAVSDIRGAIAILRATETGVFNRADDESQNAAGRMITFGTASIVPVLALLAIGVVLLRRERAAVRGEAAAAAAVAASEARYASMVSSIPAVTYTANSEGQCSFISPNVERVLGFTAQEFYDGGPPLWFENIHPDDVELVERGYRELFEGVPFDAEYRMRRKDGAWVWLYDQSLGTAEENGVVVTHGVFSDVTDRKEAQAQARAAGERFASVFHTSPLPMSINELKTGRFVEVNPAFLRDFGDAGGDLIGRTPDETGFSSEGEELGDVVRRIVRQGDFAKQIEVQLRVPSGKVHDCLVSVGLFASGGERLMLSIFDDIAAQKEMESQLRVARDEAEAASRARSEFFSRASHELRTPLNIILGFGQILEMDALPEQKESLGHILTAGRHLLQIVDEVLEISRLDAGRVALSVEPVGVEEVTSEVLGSVQEMAREAGVAVSAPEAAEGVFLLADKQRLKQVLTDLLANAVRYNHRGGEAGVSWREEPGNRIRLLVRDTGPGIVPEKVSRLFEPFDRLDAEMTQVQGTGLGLAVAKRLVEAMKGSIGVETRPGSGSTFWVEFPAAVRPALAVSAPVSTGSAGPDHIILYIEDNLANVQVVEALFASSPDIRVLVAMQGKVGLQLARSQHPEMILLDVHLPDMSGLKVLEELRSDSQTRGIPVIVASSDPGPRQEHHMLAAGATAYLPKPIDIAKLVLLTRRILEGSLPA